MTSNDDKKWPAALLIAAGAVVVYVVAQLLGAGQSLAVFLGILLPLLIGITIRSFLARPHKEHL